MIKRVDSLLENDGLAWKLAAGAITALGSLLAAGQIPDAWVGFASGLLTVLVAFVPAAGRRAVTTKRKAEEPSSEPVG